MFATKLQKIHSIFVSAKQKRLIMAHNHHHHHSNSGKNIASAFFLNATFVIIEVVGGILTNSIAILSDALHDTGDCLSLAIAWALQKKSQKSSDSRYTYGYKRFSLLGSLVLSIFLIGSTAVIFAQGIKRLITPEPVLPDGMIWIAVFGILINGAAALKVKRGSSLNERAVYLHIMEDALGWIAVLIASILMLFWDIPWIDPLLSILIGCWVLWHVIGNLRSVLRVLLQGVPEEVNLEELQQSIQTIDGVVTISELNVWSLDGEENVMTTHIITDSENASDIKQQISLIGQNYNITNVTIEIDKMGQD